VGVLVRVQDELHALLYARLSLLVGKLPLLEECLKVDPHYYVYQIDLVFVVNWLVLFNVSDDLLKLLNIRVNYLLPWLYLRLLRPGFMPENLLEQELSLLKRLLLLAGDPLLLLGLLQLHFCLLFFYFNRMAGLAPLLADFGPEFDSPAVVASASNHNVRLALHLLDKALAFLFGAGLLDAVDNLDTVMADSVFLGQLPEMMSASGAWSLHCLLAGELDIPLASDVWLGFIRISGGHQIFNSIEFWLSLNGCISLSKTRRSWMSLLTWCVKKVLDDACLENEFLLCPCGGLRKLSVHI
jgi:hypothetical protein